MAVIQCGQAIQTLFPLFKNEGSTSYFTKLLKPTTAKDFIHIFQLFVGQQ